MQPVDKPTYVLIGLSEVRAGYFLPHLLFLSLGFGHFSLELQDHAWHASWTRFWCQGQCRAWPGSLHQKEACDLVNAKCFIAILVTYIPRKIEAWSIG